VHYWTDLQSVHVFRCYDNIAPNAKCRSMPDYVRPSRLYVTAETRCAAKSVSFARCARRLLTRYVRAHLRRLPEMTSHTGALSAADRPRDWGRCAVADSNSFAHVKLQSRFLRRRRRRRRRVSGTQWTRDAVFNRIERRHKLIEID